MSSDGRAGSPDRRSSSRGSDRPVGNANSSPDRGSRFDALADTLSSLDLDVIQLVYSVIARQSRCAVCRHPLTNAIGVHVHDSGDDDPWIASISSRCDGWRRHQNEAQAWVGEEGLRLGAFQFRR